MSTSGTSRILVVDDEKSMREFLEIMLARENYHVVSARDGEEAIRILENDRFDLVITDIRMKGVDGLGVLRKVKSVSPQTVVVLISAFATAETAVEAMKEGAYDYIPKPFKVNDFNRIIAEALESCKSAVQADACSTKEKLHFGSLVGESPQMRKVYDLIQRVSGTRTNILITGESGTGKELVARAVHKAE